MQGKRAGKVAINIAFIREVGPCRWLIRTTIRQFYKRIVHRDQRMQLPTGEWINLPIADHFASEVFITRADVDWGSEALLFSLLSGRGAFLDVGAHIGYYSLYMLPRATGVFSFEPDPRARPLLERNTADQPKIEVIASAVGSTNGKLGFTLEPASELSHLAFDREIKANEIEVEVTTIDTFVASRSLSVDAIKIDIEGYDLEAIRGAVTVLQWQQPIVLTEAQPCSELFALTTQIGYSVFAFVRHARTRRKRFIEIGVERPIEGETKMVFLVPSRLRRKLESLQSRESEPV